MVETSTIWLWKEVESTKRELTDGRYRLKVEENVCSFVEHDQSMAKEDRQTVEHCLDLYISMNKDLTWEL